MDNWIQTNDLVAAISVLSREEIVELLDSEQQNTAGTLGTLKSRLRDFINARRNYTNQDFSQFPDTDDEIQERAISAENNRESFSKLPFFPPVSPVKLGILRGLMSAQAET